MFENDPASVPRRRLSARPIGRFVAACAAVALAIATIPWLGASVQADGPKVVVIVGPVGSLTDFYRAEAAPGIAEARASTSNVVVVESPNATWPAVRAALQDASLVVYLGHGNGWPSRYSDSLVPALQDGLGLNPVADVDDSAYQYFGEAYLARDVKLAPHAIVLLHHLCYASGASEPGLPEGELAIVEQRVDNYAAGWIAAGADAVLADTFFGPAYYVRSILRGGAAVDSIWRSAASFHGNVVTFASVRSPGFVGELDPTSPGSGFDRSLVARPGSNASAVADAAVPPERAPALPTAAPGPIANGASLGATPVGGTKVPLVVRLAALSPSASVAPSSTADAASAAGSPSPSAAGIRLGVQWTPLALDPLPEVAPAPEDPPGPPSAAAVASPSASPSVRDTPSAASTEPTFAAAPAPAPAAATTVPAPTATASGSPPPPAAALTALVSVETPGDLVVLADTTSSEAGLTAQVGVPDRPGLYRLVTTLHDATGVAFDVATQRRVPALDVRVTASLSVAIAAPSSLIVAAAAATALPLTVANTGSLAWQQPPPTNRRADGGAPESADPIVLGHWLSLGSATADVPASPWTPVSVAPGRVTSATLPLVAPSTPGQYLLLLDVVSPIYGSLTSAGSAPAEVRVTVGPAPPLDSNPGR